MRFDLAADCAAALRIALPNAHITAASAVPSNDSLRALGQKPYCRVEATVDNQTRIVALLPDDWNGHFLMGGAGGYVGSMESQYAPTVHEGYATVGTDAGHTAFALLAGWALRNDRRIADYGHRAVHRTAEVTKALIVAYYGRPPEHSYFIGCSNGGREALMEAQRYPADFNGIVAIAPWVNPLEWAAAVVRNLQAQYPTGNLGAPAVTPAVLVLLAAKVTEACDAIDGVRDGILENPEACTFKLASLPARCGIRCGRSATKPTRRGGEVAAVVSATNPDLSAFRARGGKLLLAHGWSDSALSARSTIEYFKALQRRTPQASSFTRLFLMPGVLHCGGRERLR
jgi:pimeloyl-ACP methyl ester carboxylesterase